jgi:hypothetical protein
VTNQQPSDDGADLGGLQARFTIHVSRFAIVLAIIALILFARLTQRHVGESYFLADQVDQLQKYEAALRLEPEGLWGPAMSGTAARALGPVGALTFGLPVSLGFGIDAIHGTTSLLLAVATALALWQLARVNFVFAWIWFIAFTAMRMVWWNAAMFWVNTLLLPIGLVVLALFAANLRRPSWTKVATIAFFLLLALHVHLAALVGFPIPVIAALYLVRSRQTQQAGPLRPRCDSGGRTSLVLAITLIVAALLPYALAEAKTDFRNTRAMFSHVDTAVRADSGDGRRAAVETLVLATDPLSMQSPRPSLAITTGAAVATIALVLLAWRRSALHENAAETSRMLWMVSAAVVGVAGQALFFLIMGRPLNGLHYAIFLAPWYPLPLAALAAALPSTRHFITRAASIGLGILAIALLLFRAPLLADRFAERTPWNYHAIVTALDTLCGGQTVQTVEGPGLVNDLTPSSDSVLKYLLKRGHSQCRYDANADVVIAANRAGAFDETIGVGGRRFVRETVLPPGLARYQLLRERP